VTGEKNRNCTLWGDKRVNNRSSRAASVIVIGRTVNGVPSTHIVLPAVSLMTGSA
jgi:hypothetical protein